MPIKDPDKRREVNRVNQQKSRERRKLVAPKYTTDDVVYLLADIREILAAIADVELEDDRFRYLKQDDEGMTGYDVTPDEGMTGYDVIPESESSGMTGMTSHQNGRKPAESSAKSNGRIVGYDNGVTGMTSHPYKDDVVVEENIKTNNNTINNNNKNAGAPSAPAPGHAPASADTRTIARLRHTVDGVKPASEAPRLVGKCPYETTLGAEKLRQFTETVQKRFPDINGLTWTVKQLRHAYQQVGDATLDELTAAFREYFRAMDATRNGPKGLTSIDGWTRTTLATAISDAKLASEYAESGT